MFRKVQKWMRAHKFSDKKQTENINNVQFAREFFEIVDDKDSGGVDLNQLSVPLIALGLSSDSAFIEKVLKAINPFKFGEKSGVLNPFEINAMSLKDFIKIFKKDQVSEKLTDAIRSLVVAEKEEQRVKRDRMLEKKQEQLQIIKEKVPGSTFTIIDDSDDDGDDSPVQRLPTTSALSDFNPAGFPRKPS